MIEFKAIRYSPNQRLVGNTMDAPPPPMVLEKGISILINTRRPLPAPVLKDANLAPKSEGK